VSNARGRRRIAVPHHVGPGTRSPALLWCPRTQSRGRDCNRFGVFVSSKDTGPQPPRGIAFTSVSLSFWNVGPPSSVNHSGMPQGTSTKAIWAKTIRKISVVGSDRSDLGNPLFPTGVEELFSEDRGSNLHGPGDIKPALDLSRRRDPSTCRLRRHKRSEDS
jgi:hypothetical protein